jgi:hypothetical protein
MKRIVIPLLVVCAFGLRFNASQVEALAAGAQTTIVAPAGVYFVGAHGGRIYSARAGQSIRFALKFPVPRTFPIGYTDVRFTVFVHAKPERTVIYGAALRLTPGKTFQMLVPATIARSWRGLLRVVGTVTLLSKPGGASLNRAGRGSAILRVTP